MTFRREECPRCGAKLETVVVDGPDSTEETSTCSRCSYRQREWHRPAERPRERERPNQQGDWARALGCAAFIEKPTTPLDVLHEVERLIGHAPMLDEPDAMPQIAPSRGDSGAGPALHQPEGIQQARPRSGGTALIPQLQLSVEFTA